MLRRRPHVTHRSLFAAAAFVLCVLASPSVARGQAWLPLKGEGAVSTGVQIFQVSWHLERDGSRQEETNVSIRNITADFSYGLTDRLAIGFGVPLVSSKWGELSHPCPDPIVSDTGAFIYLPCAVAENLELDNGKYYTALQDVRANLRYGLWTRHVTLTPFAGVVLPSHSYETYGHVAPGRRLSEVNVGFHAGRSLGPKLPDTYVQTTYAYTISEGVRHHELDLNLNRSNFDIEVGHQLTPRLLVQGFMTWQFAHGGLEWVDELFTSEHEEIHDRAAKASHRRGGVNLSIAVRPGLALNFSVLRTLAGKNSHKLDGFAVGTTWSFSRRGDEIIGAGRQ